MSFLSFVVALVFFTSSVAAQFDFEWLGVTDVPTTFPQASTPFWWVAGKNAQGVYEQPSMIAVFAPLTASQVGASDLVNANEQTLKAAMEAAEESAHQLILQNPGNCINVTTCDAITPSPTTCYRMLFNHQSPLSLFQIHSPVVEGAADPVVALAAFTEHVPQEFETTVPFFINANGELKEFILQEFQHGHNHEDGPQSVGRLHKLQKIVGAGRV